MTEKEWLEERKKGIGGSDASAIMGQSPWKTNVDLWMEKTGRKEAEDISEKPCVVYGKTMEPLLREMFRVNNPQYEVKHEENTIIRHSKYPFLFASLDGMLIDKETGEIGILEIKTTNIHKPETYAKEWKDGIKPAYYCQILHYMNVIGAEFAKVYVNFKYSEDFQKIRTYTITRQDPGVEEDIKLLEEKEIEFWNEYVLKDKRPNLKINFKKGD